MSKFDLYIGDALRAIDLIEGSVLSYDELKRSRELIDATSMRIQIIGESLNKLPENFKNFVEFDKVVKLRNIISHAYFVVNPMILWSFIKKDLPELKKRISETNIRDE